MYQKQPQREEVFMTIQATPNEIIALNHVLAPLLAFHEEQSRKGKAKDEVVLLLERFYRRIGGGVRESQ